MRAAGGRTGSVTCRPVVMGCRHSKVLPEAPGDVQLDLVKKVEPQTHHTDVYSIFTRGGTGTAGTAGRAGTSGDGSTEKTGSSTPHSGKSLAAAGATAGTAATAATVPKTGQSPTPAAQAAAAAPSDPSAEPRRNKVARYRAKFDPRVTAKYEIKALIGRGSFSRVVRVEHKGTRRPYAIKMIETRCREGREVCESELNVLRRVRHTNIIQLMEVSGAGQCMES